MNSIRISHIGLTQWETVFIETTVNIAAGLEIADWQYVKDPKTADVLLLAPGRKDAHAPGTGGGAKPDSIQQITRECARPVTHTTLIAQLKEIEEELRAPVVEADEPPVAVAGTNERDKVAVNTDADDAAISALAGKSRPARRFIEGTRFLGMLQEAVRSGRTTELTHPEYPAVTVFPGQDVYTSLGDPVTTPAMFRASSLEYFKRDISDAIAAVMLSIDQRRPLFQLVYCAALYGSEGRMLRHANPDDKLFLVEEPDFGLVPYTAEHRKLANQMMDGPASLAQLVTVSGADIGTVIDFCNACEATGLIRRGNSGEPGDDDGGGEHDDRQTPAEVRYLFDSR